MATADHRDQVAGKVERRSCPRCRRECRLDETFCLSCDQDLSQPALPRLGWGQFSLTFLLGLMATVAVALGVYRWSPDVAIGLWIVLLPALGRTGLAAYLRRRHGGQLSPRRLGLTFLVSLAAMIPVLTIAFAGSLLGILTSPFWMGLFETDPRRAALVSAAVCALAGACYGFWITRPNE